MENWQDTTTPLLEGEIWKDVPGFEGYYQASNKGRIKSLDRYIQYPTYKRIFYGRILQQFQEKGGYTSCSPLVNDVKKMRARCHRVIAMAFIPNPNGLSHVNHINGCKYDNRPDNLEWCTPLQNTQHAIRTGLLDVRIKIYEYDTSGKFTREWGSITDAAKFYHRTPATIVYNMKSGSEPCAGRYFRYDKSDNIKLRKRKYKKIAVCDNDGNTLQVFDSGYEVAELLGCKYNTIVASICHKTKTKGFTFKYI